ncbi:MAG: helix-turn-helix transcriptional regulator [Planctomycetota bacterium]|nr:helix-turn-helix transcriptional regulator [Planctomycetota bacterium]
MTLARKRVEDLPEPVLVLSLGEEEGGAVEREGAQVAAANHSTGNHAAKNLGKAADRRELGGAREPAEARSVSTGKSAQPRESRGVTIAQIARNLILARHALGVTQEELAASSGVSRATIAQIESGGSDFRLSSLLDIAQALGISPALLFVRAGDIASVGRFVRQASVDRVLGTLPAADVDRMKQWRSTGLQKDLFRVVHSAADAAQTAGYSSAGAAVGAGIGSAESPGLGTAIGTLLGAALDRGRDVVPGVVEDGEGI